ncbi:MAG: class II aldolase/adducin family protein [Candidatus Heimdallarchaeota archaeon]|nr:class II aldolase/adducin family protein [Candidatus Heimdallarchaeota archaeon]
MTKKQLTLKQDMARVCRQIYEKGLTYSTGGNISVKLDNDTFLIKPADYCFGDIRGKDFIIINKKGEIIEGPRGNRPSSETPMHLTVYRDIKDVNAVIHAHSPNTMVFATMGMAIEAATTFAEEEVGFVPVAPYRVPGTQDLAEIAAKTLKSVEKGLYPPPNQPAIACLLEKHGVLVAGKSLMKTFYALESLETTARTILWMKVLENSK